MKRDMGLVRELLLKLEDLDMPPLGTAMINPWDEELAVEGRTGEEILYHLELIVDAGLVEVQGSGFGGSGQFLFKRLSFSGHDFLDSIRDPEIWRQTKAGISKVGGAGIEVVWGIAKEVVKAEIKKRTGFDIGGSG